MRVQYEMLFTETTAAVSNTKDYYKKPSMLNNHSHDGNTYKCLYCGVYTAIFYNDSASLHLNPLLMLRPEYPASSSSTAHLLRSSRV